MAETQRRGCAVSVPAARWDSEAARSRRSGRPWPKNGHTEHKPLKYEFFVMNEGTFLTTKGHWVALEAQTLLQVDLGSISDPISAPETTNKPI